MSGIGPVSGLGAFGIQPPGIKPQEQQPKQGFGDLLNQAAGKVTADQDSTAVAVQDLLAGRSEDVLPVVTAVAKSDLSFKLLMGVRNKVIEAYKQTMNMQDLRRLVSSLTR